MTIRRVCSVVISLVAVSVSSPRSGAQGPARVADPAAHRATPRVGQENVPEGEAEAIEELKKFQIAVMNFRAAGEKPTERGQHGKHHGFVVARFTVLKDIPDALKVGLFRKPRSYTAVLRFSNGAGSIDAMPDMHGMAIKLLGVEGEKLLEGEKDAQTQDFVLLDHPLFFASDVSSLLGFGKAGVALLKDKAVQEKLKDQPEQGRKELLEALAKKWPKETAIVASRLDRPPASSPLALEYFSTTPYKLGATAVKYGAKPERPFTPTQAKKEGKDYLREAMVEQLTSRRQPATFGFYVQRQGDPEAMPIEDPTVEWTSKWEKVATIEVGAQDFDFPARVVWGDALSYTPWHALKEHRPLGGINRARKVIYPASSELRHHNLGAPRKEPTEADIPKKK
jgi:catalase